MPLLYESIYGTPVGDIEQSILRYLRSFAPDRYQDALAEAAKISKEQNIPMTVESLKPIHFGWTSYKLPVGTTFITLKTNVRFYPVGLFSIDEDFTTLKWWEGAKIGYICDWPAFWVPERKEKQATMTPQPIFKTSFAFEVESSTPKAYVDAWILAYVVLPQTMREMRVIS